MQFGVSYYPELVDAAEWPRDLALMRQAGLQVIRMLDFAWTAIEPREGCYTWDWLDRFLDLAHAQGLSVVLCTPTATPPAWLAQQYPSIMIELADGRRRAWGSRRDVDPCSTIYRAYCTRLARDLGGRYGRHPAVIGWQIDNELIGPELADPESHSLDATWQFRLWLREKYGSVEALNRAWYLRFWCQEFADWGEVTTPRRERVATGWAIDYSRFFDEAQMQFLRCQYDALRGAIEPRQWVSHNSTGMLDRGLDHGAYARRLDVGGWDAYFGAASAGHGHQAAFSAFVTDWLRTATGQPVWIFETNPGNEACTPAYMAELRAHGAQAILFWHWRQHRGNVEQSAMGICDLAGRPWADRLARVQAVTRRAEFRQPLPAKVTKRSAAILFSVDCFRAHLHPGPYGRKGYDYLHALISLYEPFWRAGVALDVVAPGDDLSGYQLLLMPGLRLLDEADAQPIRRFVENGGVLLGCAKTAHQTTTAVYYPALGQPLADLLGTELRADVRNAEPVRIRLDDGREFPADPWVEALDGCAGKVLGTFVDGPAAGRPALFRRPFGKGTVYYLAAPSMALARELAPQVAEAAGLRAVAHTGPDVSICPDPDTGVTWYINHGPDEREVGGVRVPAKDFVQVKG